MLDKVPALFHNSIIGISFIQSHIANQERAHLLGDILAMSETADYILDELARIEDIDEPDKLLHRIERLLHIGYTAKEIVRGFNLDYRWDDEHGRIEFR